MAFPLAFALPSAPTSRLAHPTNAATWKPQRPAPSLEVSGSTCAAVSAAFTVAVGQALSRKRTKPRAVRSVLHSFDPTREVGVMEPMGYWDPLNLMRQNRVAGAPFRDEETFRWYRAAELKHGRVCMLAMTGLISANFWKFPGFEKVPSGLAALQTPEALGGLAIIVGWVGIFENDAGKQDPSKAPGDLGNPLVPDKEEERELFTVELRNKELAHCRLAMSGFLYCLVQDLNGIPPETFLKMDNMPSLSKALIPILLFAISLTNAKDYQSTPTQEAWVQPALASPEKTSK